jgi:hypothetical protein
MDLFQYTIVLRVLVGGVVIASISSMARMPRQLAAHGEGVR